MPELGDLMREGIYAIPSEKEVDSMMEGLEYTEQSREEWDELKQYGMPRGTRLPALSRKLKETGKTTGTDSGSYRDVVMGAEMISSNLFRPVSPADFPSVREEAADLYFQFIISCHEYIRTHKRTWTPSGKARKALVIQLLEIAERDMTALSELSSEIPADGGSIRIMLMLEADARTVKINLDSDPRQVTEIGAGSSTRLKFTHGGKEVFFTREETLSGQLGALRQVVSEIENDEAREAFKVMIEDPFLKGQLVSEKFSDIEETVREKNQEHERANSSPARAGMEPLKIYSSPQDYLRSECSFAKIKGFNFDSDANCELFINTCKALFRANNGSLNFQTLGGIGVGSVTSTRNVAMTRIADLLGIGDLIARSVNAQVTLGGKTQSGNLMERAKGAAISDFTQEEITNADISSGELQRQLICMQVLDTLCGQVDRHIGNYFLSSKPDEHGHHRFTGIQGIDNDMSFGRVDARKKKHLLMRFVDDAGMPTLPVIDRQLGERLLALTPDMLLVALGDIINSKPEQKALISRLLVIQSTLRKMKEMEAESGEKVFLDVEDWGETTRKALTAPKRITNYYQALIFDFERAIGQISSGHFDKESPKSTRGAKISKNAFVMSAETLSFLLNRKERAAQEDFSVEKRLVEALGAYHAAQNEAQAAYRISVVLSICVSRKNEFDRKAQIVIERLKKQCEVRGGDVLSHTFY